MKKTVLFSLLILASASRASGSGRSAEQILHELQEKYSVDPEKAMQKGMYYAGNEALRELTSAAIEVLGNDIPIVSGILKRQNQKAIRRNFALQSQAFDLQKIIYRDAKAAERALVSTFSSEVERMANGLIANLLDPMPSHYSPLTRRSEKVQRDMSFCADGRMGLGERVKRFSRTDRRYLNREITEENIAICLKVLEELELYRKREEKIMSRLQKQIISTPDDDSSTLKALQKQIHRTMNNLRGARDKKLETNACLLDLRERIAAIEESQKLEKFVRNARTEMWQHLPNNSRPPMVEEEDAWEVQAYIP